MSRKVNSIRHTQTGKRASVSFSQLLPLTRSGNLSTLTQLVSYRKQVASPPLAKFQETLLPKVLDEKIRPSSHPSLKLSNEGARKVLGKYSVYKAGFVLIKVT